MCESFNPELLSLIKYVPQICCTEMVAGWEFGGKRRWQKVARIPRQDAHLIETFQTYTVTTTPSILVLECVKSWLKQQLEKKN